MEMLNIDYDDLPALDETSFKAHKRKVQDIRIFINDMEKDDLIINGGNIDHYDDIYNKILRKKKYCWCDDCKAFYEYHGFLCPAKFKQQFKTRYSKILHAKGKEYRTRYFNDLLIKNF